MSKPSEVLREELYHFAMIMEGQLQEHEGRGGWRGEPLDYLFKRLVEETGELSAALLGHKDKEKMIRECADVANFAMMIADNLRQASARMSEPEAGQHELLEVLSEITSAADAEGAVDQRDKEVIQALRRLIEEKGEWERVLEKWQRRAAGLIEFRIREEGNLDNFALALLAELRDFDLGKEAADEQA